MDRRAFLAASAVGVATATAGCTNSLLQTSGSSPDEGSTNAERDYGAPPEDDPGNEIRVSGRGEVEADPDRASLSVGVEATGDTADGVNEQLRTEAEELRDAFDDLGIAEENVESGQFDVRQRRRESGFEGTHSFRIELDDPDRVGEVIDATVSAGADDVGRVSFELRPETRESLREEALDEALADADAEAEAVADNRGVEITGTKAVSTEDVGVEPEYASTGDEAMEADDAGAPPTEIESGPVSVSASVTVTYSYADPA